MKGDLDSGGQREWTMRIYSADNTVGRANRISFYLFNLSASYGVGAYVQETVVPGNWIHLIATVNGTNIRLYKNSVLKYTEPYSASNLGNGHAPIRIGTGMHLNGSGGAYGTPSYFEGSIDDVSILESGFNSS